MTARALEPPALTPLEAFARADEWERAALVVALFFVPAVSRWFDGGAVERPGRAASATAAPRSARAATVRLVRPPRSC